MASHEQGHPSLLVRDVLELVFLVGTRMRASELCERLGGGELSLILTRDKQGRAVVGEWWPAGGGLISRPP